MESCYSYILQAINFLSPCDTSHLLLSLQISNTFLSLSLFFTDECIPCFTEKKSKVISRELPQFPQQTYALNCIHFYIIWFFFSWYEWNVCPSITTIHSFFFQLYTGCSSHQTSLPFLSLFLHHCNVFVYY